MLTGYKMTKKKEFKMSQCLRGSFKFTTQKRIEFKVIHLDL